MLDKRTAYERRVWRLAYLLTGGDERAAAGLVFDIVDRQPNLKGLDAAHLDRLVVLASRERRSAGKPAPTSTAGDPSDAARAVFHAAAGMPAQLLEAWVLTRVDGMGEVHVSRATDCSKTASSRHLAAADEHMIAASEMPSEQAAAKVREFADSLDAGPSLERFRVERKKRRRLVLVLLAAVVLGGAVLVLRLFLR